MLHGRRYGTRRSGGREPRHPNAFTPYGALKVVLLFCFSSSHWARIAVRAIIQGFSFVFLLRNGSESQCVPLCKVSRGQHTVQEYQACGASSPVHAPSPLDQRGGGDSSSSVSSGSWAHFCLTSESSLAHLRTL